MKATRLPYHLFDLYPYKVSSFGKLPFLQKDISQECVAVGTSVAISFTGAAILSDMKKNDPIWSLSLISGDSGKIMIILIGIMITISIIFAFKQYEYYYGESNERGKKSGVFKRNIKEINRAERFVDIILATMGGVLFSSSLLPTFWFLTLSIYSLVCIIRFYITLRRDHYIRRTKKRFLDFYYKTTERKHNGMKVKELLLGWIISFTVLGSIGLIAFIFLMISTVGLYYNVITVFVMVGLICGFSFFFGNLSFSLGKKMAKMESLSK